MGSTPPHFADQLELAMDDVEALLADTGMATADLVQLRF